MSVTWWPALAETFAATFRQAPVAVQVFGRSVVRAPVVSSVSVAVAQSKVTVSGQETLTQNESCEAFDGRTKVCEIVLSAEGSAPPSRAPHEPPCASALA